MRSLITVATAAAIVAAGFPTVPGFAQNAVTPVRVEATAPNTAIVEIFKAFPNGGEELSNRIADFLVKNRKLAPDLAHYVIHTPGLSNAQKVAAERGLAKAMERLGINAADLGYPVKAPPPVEAAPAVFSPVGLILAALIVGGLIACAFECFKEEKHVFVSTDN